MEDAHRPLPTSTRAYVLATVVLVVVLIVSLLFYFLSADTKPGQQGKGGTNEATTNTAASVATPPPPEPEVLTSRYGTITELRSSALRFETPVFNEKTSLYEKKILTAELTSETSFIQIDRAKIPVPPAPGQPARPSSERKVIDRTVLKVGDTVNVLAAENIKEKTGFSATEIQRILLTH